LWKWNATHEEKEDYRELMRKKVEELSCPHEECEDYGEKGKGNIVFVRKYGAGETQNLFKCKTCGKTFSDRKGTPLFGFILNEEKILDIIMCLVEGNGIRKTARIQRVDKDTVTRILKAFGEHMKAVYEYFMHDYHMEECQFDELWTFIRKKENNLSELEKLIAEFGDMWVGIGFDSINKVIASLVVGKRNEELIDKLVGGVKKVTDNHIPLFTSDGLRWYEKKILKHYGIQEKTVRTGKRGRPVKPKKMPHPDLKYAQVVKQYKKGKVAKVEFKVVFGNEKEGKKLIEKSPVSKHINTSFVERNNLTLRENNGRLSRKTLSFSKETEGLVNQLWLFMGYYHFVRPHGGLAIGVDAENGRKRWTKRTPFKAAGITNRIWTLRELVTFRIPPK